MHSGSQNGRQQDPSAKRPVRQMALLLVTAGVSFALGLTVGRNTAPVEPTVKIKVPASRITLEQKDNLTFYKTLPRGETAALGTGINRVPPPPATSSTPAIHASQAAPAATPAATLPSTAVTKPAADSSQGAVDKPTVRGASWVLQAASVPADNEAQSLCNRLRRKDYQCFVEPAEVKGKTWYRVFVGPFNDSTAAKNMASKLSQQEKLSAIVRKR